MARCCYFTDRERTEVVVYELLMGLNYRCRYEQHSTVPAALATMAIVLQPFSSVFIKAKEACCWHCWWDTGDGG